MEVVSSRMISEVVRIIITRQNSRLLMFLMLRQFRVPAVVANSQWRVSGDQDRVSGDALGCSGVLIDVIITAIDDSRRNSSFFTV